MDFHQNTHVYYDKRANEIQNYNIESLNMKYLILE